MAPNTQTTTPAIKSEIATFMAAFPHVMIFGNTSGGKGYDWPALGWHEFRDPNEEWEQLLHRVKRLADDAGFYRWPFPKQYGGSDGNNLGMAIIREHLARRGLGLHNDLQNESSIVGNNVGLLLMLHHGTEEQKAEWVDDLAEGRRGFAFGTTEPNHGSDATHMETTAVRDGDEWVITGQKVWTSSAHVADLALAEGLVAGASAARAVGLAPSPEGRARDAQRSRVRRLRRMLRLPSLQVLHRLLGLKLLAGQRKSGQLND